MGGEQSVFGQSNHVAADLTPGLVKMAMGAGADEAQVLTVEEETFEVNFERNELTLLRSYVDQTSLLTVYCDTKKGSSKFTGNTALAQATQDALQAAQAGVPDEANRISANLGPIRGGELGRSLPDREGMVEGVVQYLADLKAEFPHILTQSSFYSFTLTKRFFANSNGASCQEQRGSHHFTTCFSAKDGDRSTSFNYTYVSSYEPFARLMEAGNLRSLLRESSASFEPKQIPRSFTGDVIIAPDCMPTVMGALGSALEGYNLLSGTTPYADSRGELITSERLSLLNRPRWDQFSEGAAFDNQGVATEDLKVIANGRLTNFLIDHYVSNKLGFAQTAGRQNFVVPSGDDSLESLIANTEEGILLSRLSGGRPNRNLDFTGVAKNSFYIRDGKIQFPLTETMVAGNFQSLLSEIRGISKESINFGSCQYPWLAASGVSISRK